MRILGLEISRTKAVPNDLGTLAPVDNRGSWFGFVREAFAGAWQRNIVVDREHVLAYPTVFACITVISSDIAKLCWDVQQYDADNDIWKKAFNSAYSGVLMKPNGYQNYIQFKEQWMLSKLTHGNTYVLKVRDSRGVVNQLYILHPRRVIPYVAEDGSVWYSLNRDNLIGNELLEDGIMVPASEIIHDRFNCLFHPLVGLSPIFACGLAAMQGVHIQQNTAHFFKNGAMPSGILTAPGHIPQDTADRLKNDWDQKYSGQNSGKVAVLGDGLQFEKLTISAADSQVIQQLNWGDEKICSVFHMPQYKVGVGAVPSYNNVEALQQGYYDDCLQIHIESMEQLMDDGLGMGTNTTVGMDLDGLLRMDTTSKTNAATESIKGSLRTINEARKPFNLPPVPGGDSVYLQQQNFSLEALVKRDSGPDPFAAASGGNLPAPSPSQSASSTTPQPNASSDAEEQAAEEARQADWFRKSFEAFELEINA